MDALGRLFDIGVGFMPVDLDTANGATGKRISLRDAAGITFVIIKAAGTAGADPTFDVQQHTANTGGTSADLDVVTRYYLKKATTLAGTETWSKFTQTAASEVIDPGGATTSAEEEQILVIEVEAASLTDGYGYVSIVATVTAANPQLCACIYLLRDLAVQRAPQNLRTTLS